MGLDGVWVAFAFLAARAWAPVVLALDVPPANVFAAVSAKIAVNATLPAMIERLTQRSLSRAASRPELEWRRWRFGRFI